MSRELTKEQQDWLEQRLELWGAWGLEKRMSSMIAQWISGYPTRPMCNDDDGMLISQVVDSVLKIDPKAFGILLSYYAHGSTEHGIASYSYKTAKPRKIPTRGGNKLKRPSMSTCRREVREILDASRYVIYFPLLNAINNRKSVGKVRKIA